MAFEWVAGLFQSEEARGLSGESAASVALDESNPFYTRDLDKCILCTRCVRTCKELVRIKGVLRHWHFTTALRYVAEARHVEYATLRDFSQAFRQQQLNAGMTVDLGRQ